MDTLVTVLLAVTFTVALTAWSALRWLYERDDLPSLRTVCSDLAAVRAFLRVHAVADDAIAAMQEEVRRWEG